MERLQKKIFESSIYQIAMGYEEDKLAHANKRTTWEWLFNQNPFPLESYQQEDEDVDNVDIALLQAKELQSLLNIERMIDQQDQLDGDHRRAFDVSLLFIKDYFKKIITLMKEVYLQSDLLITAKKREIITTTQDLEELFFTHLEISADKKDIGEIDIGDID